MSILDLLLPTIFVLGGLLAGVLADRLLIVRLNRAARAGNPNATAFAAALRRRPIIWLGLAGLYGAVTSLPLGEQPRLQRLQYLIAGVLLIVLIFSVTLAAARLADDTVALYTGQPTAVHPTSSIFANLVRIVVFIIGGLMAFQALNIRVTPILTALGVGGVAVALALQDTLSNLFAGIYILVSRKLRPGDFVQLESGAQGYIRDINLRHTTIRELANNLVVVPNTRMASTINRNFDLPGPEVAVTLDVTVSHANDLALVEDITLEVARDTLANVPGGVAEFEPQVRYQAFAEIGIRFTAVLRARAFGDQFLLKHEFIKRLHRRYGDTNIRMALLPAPAVRYEADE
jgi:small-conductance mechanosensitive channel